MQRLTRSSSFTQGFTIIELLVVITVIGILSAVILTGTASARAKGRQSAAMQTMKSVHDLALICVNTAVTGATFCYPGANTGGCTSTAVGDTNDGGGGALCSNNPNGRYAALPVGYVYCNGAGTAQGATDCGNDTSGPSGSSFRIRAESPAEDVLITCDEAGCTASADTD